MNPLPHPAHPERKTPSSANRTGQESIDYNLMIASYGRRRNEKRVPIAQARKRFAEIRRMIESKEVAR